MLRSILRVRFLPPLNQTTSFSQYKRTGENPFAGRYRNDDRQRGRHNNEHEYSKGWGWRRSVFRGGATTVTPILAFTWWDTAKDILGIEKVNLDNHPLKNKIKQAMLYRRHNRFTEAVDVLQEALKEAKASKVEDYITRVYDEIANTYYEMNELEKASELFREVIQRLVRLHAKNEASPEFIGISLKMADIFARLGNLENAEIGFKHCVSRQLQVMEEHQKKYIIDKGAVFEDRTPPDTFGPEYSDPIALFGMALESYAYFLLDYFNSERLTEVEEFMDEVLKISNHLYGSCSTHSVYLINNFGARCIYKNQYKLARKYLEIALNRVLNINDCEPILVSYYCNYAEALFHTNDEARAVEFARKAELFSRSQEPRVQRYAEKFRREMERDARRNGIRLQPAADGQNAGWRSWLPV